jgi:very-short-patch-repair endonuclease
MDIELKVLAMAGLQHGLVANRQIRELGGDRHLTIRRVRQGRWEQVTSRVIRIAGTPRTAEQHLMAALLHAGPVALASHESAAWLWQLPGFAASDVVTRPRSNGGRVELGHRPKLLLPHHRTEVRGIPCTTLPRTIYDIAGVLPPGRTASLVALVVKRSPAMLPALHQMLPELAQRGRPGIAVMRQILQANPVGTKMPESGNEARFEQICRNAGIVGLERQVDLGGHSWLGRVDYLLRRLRLVIEVDSALHHESDADKARDEVRDEAMLAAGIRKVLRIKAEDLWPRPWLVVQQVREAIAELERMAA